MFSRGRSWIIGTSSPPACIASAPCAAGSATDSNICRLACANRDSSRSTGGIVKKPGRYTTRHSAASSSASRRHRPDAPSRPAPDSSPPPAGMWTSWRNARDYNRGLPAPVRWAHIALSAAHPLARPIASWATNPRRASWAPALLVGLFLTLLLLPFDGALSRLVAHIRLGGDIRRELEALQQYGQGLSSLLIAAVIWAQDPPRRRKLANWAAALILAFAAVFLLKTMLGRPRPKYDDPWFFLGPFGAYPVTGAGVRHAWELWGGISSDLWSMPSSHTAYAVVMAVFISATYPRLRPLVFLVAALVGVGRILTRAHYPSDVAAGWTIGAAVASAAITARCGERVLDHFMRRPSAQAVPGSSATPALSPGASHAAERSRELSKT